MPESLPRSVGHPSYAYASKPGRAHSPCPSNTLASRRATCLSHPETIHRLPVGTKLEVPIHLLPLHHLGRADSPGQAYPARQRASIPSTTGRAGTKGEKEKKKKRKKEIAKKRNLRTRNPGSKHNVFVCLALERHVPPLCAFMPPEQVKASQQNKSFDPL